MRSPTIPSIWPDSSFRCFIYWWHNWFPIHGVTLVWCLGWCLLVSQGGTFIPFLWDHIHFKLGLTSRVSAFSVTSITIRTGICVTTSFGFKRGEGIIFNPSHWRHIHHKPGLTLRVSLFGVIAITFVSTSDWLHIFFSMASPSYELMHVRTSLKIVLKSPL